MLENITYRSLTINECDRISEIDPSQYIEKVWRKINGEYQLVTIDYMENDWPDGYEKYRDCLIETIKTGGIAIGAFDDSKKMIAFITLNNNFFGEKYKHLLLDSMFVSKEHRGKGIGKTLFNMVKEIAITKGADKLYICAGSAEDTIAFYKSVGCIEAEEINQEFYESDPRDMQLEYSLNEFVIVEATKEESYIVDDGIVEYNNSQVPFTQVPTFESIKRVIKDRNNIVIAGITGVLYCWNILYVDILWVHNDYRGKKLGSKLLKEVETVAKSKGCYLVHLDTFDFQAKDFYLKNGYEVFGILDDCPKEHKRYYLKKLL